MSSGRAARKIGAVTLRSAPDAPALALLLAASALVAFVGCVPASDDDDSGTPPPVEGLAEDCATDGFDWGRGAGLMLPGTDCLSCHQEGGHAVNAFSAGGTVFARPDCPEPRPGAIVHIQDDEGTELDLPVNEVGNFWSTDPLAPPFIVEVEFDGETAYKDFEVDSLSCNECHQVGAEGGLVSVGGD